MIPYLLTASEDEEALARGVADVSSLQVASVYAEALLNAAEQTGQVDAVIDDYDALLNTVPLFPITHKLFALAPQMPHRSVTIGVGCTLHAVPFQRITMP